MQVQSCFTGFETKTHFKSLKMLHMCLPDGSKLPKSSYLFEQENEKELKYNSTKYITCMSCQTLLAEDLLCDNQQCNCYRISAEGENSSVFYIIDILPELKRLISGSIQGVYIYMYIYHILVPLSG